VHVCTALTLRYARTAQGIASGHAQARSRPAPGTLKHAQAAQTRSGAPQEGADAQEGTDTLKKAHQARSSTLRQAQDGPARLRHAQRRLRHAQAGSGKLRHASDTLRHAQKPQTGSDMLGKLRHAPYGSSTLAQAGSGRHHSTNTLRLSRHAQEGSNSRLRHPQAQAGGQAGLKRAVRQARVAKESRNCRKRLVSFRPDHMPRPKMINSSLRSLLR
jgi:hypothetical protein